MCTYKITYVSSANHNHNQTLYLINAKAIRSYPNGKYIIWILKNFNEKIEMRKIAEQKGSVSTILANWSRVQSLVPN